jgi:hypothetical protein
LISDTRAVEGSLGHALFAYQAEVRVESSAFLRNQEVGVSLVGEGGRLEVGESLISDTRPVADGSYGVGVGCSRYGSGPPDLVLTRALVRGSSAAGLLSRACYVELQSTRIQGVAPGAFHRFSPQGEIEATYTEISDGIAATVGSELHVSNLAVADVGRAALVFDDSFGVLAGARASGGRFGLVIQGSKRPDFSDPDNRFVGTELPILSDGDLPVPAPPQIPQN